MLLVALMALFPFMESEMVALLLELWLIEAGKDIAANGLDAGILGGQIPKDIDIFGFEAFVNNYLRSTGPGGAIAADMANKTGGWQGQRNRDEDQMLAEGGFF